MKHLQELLEGSNISCPGCGENFGKDTENSKKITCGNCGDVVNNPRGEDDEEPYNPPSRQSHTSGYNRQGSGGRAAADSRARAFMHEDQEEFDDEDDGMDNYDMAIDMINQAVEKHNALDEFEKIADVDSLVDYLRSTRHDFNEKVEQTVRDIIADETGSSEEQEEFRGGGKTNINTSPDFKGPGKQEYYRNSGNKKYQGKLVKAARMIPAKREEEEIDMDRIRAETKAVLDDSRKRKMAREFGISGPSRRSGGVRRRDLGRARGTFGLEQEEDSIDDTMNQRRRGRRPVRDEGRDTRRSRRVDPKRAFARQMARIARPHVGAEQEEFSDSLSDAGRKRMDDMNWDEEVRKFRERRPKDDHGRASRRMIDRKRATHSRNPFSVGFEQEETKDRTNRLKRRRRNTSDSGAFAARFESFKQFINETPDDS